MITVIEPRTWRAQPWRNGAGTTYEILREPAAGEVFDVRVSVAEVTAPAPFSAFPGVRRWLFLLAGGPVILDHEGTAVTLGAVGDGLAFAGEARVAATEVATPSRDLNFMVRGDLAATAEIVRGTTLRHASGGRIGVFAIAGDVRVDGTVLDTHAFAWGAGPCAIAVGAGAIAAVIELRV